MRVTARGPRLSMAEQLANDREAHAAPRTYRREGMPQIVNAKALQHGMPSDRLPRTLEVGTGLAGIVASDDEGADAREAFEHRQGGSVEDHRPLPGFRGRQEQHAALEIHVAPFQMQNFTETTAREQQK